MQKYKFRKCTPWEAQTPLAKLAPATNTAVYVDSDQKEKKLQILS